MPTKLVKLGRPLIAVLALVAIAFAFSISSPQRTQAGAAVAVQITNSLVPVDTETAARTPFQTNFFDSGGGLGSFTVPGQQRLVIEFVSAHCDTPGQLIGMNISTSVLGRLVYHYLQPVYNGGSGGVSTYTVSQLTRLYADGGSDVALSDEVSGSEIHCAYEVSGYFIRP